MKVLIYGSNGWIGNQFISIMVERGIDFVKGVARVDNEDAVKNELETVYPSHVVSFIGRTHGSIDGKSILQLII